MNDGVLERVFIALSVNECFNLVKVELNPLFAERSIKKNKKNIMKKLVVFMFFTLGIGSLFAQEKYFSKTATVKFHSDSKMEKIEGTNSKSSTVIDASSGKLEFAVLVNAFQFDKSLMQEHFNENYMESTKYPKATFKGSIENNDAVKYNTNGTYKINVKGDMTVHGVTKQVSFPAELKIDEKGIHAVSKFSILCSDYNITIPALVKDKLSNKIDITINSDYQKMK